MIRTCRYPSCDRDATEGRFCSTEHELKYEHNYDDAQDARAVHNWESEHETIRGDSNPCRHTKATRRTCISPRTGRPPLEQHDHRTRGWLGNPHRLEDGYTRAESIDLFRDDFEAKLRGDDEFREAVRELAEKTLGCWCQRVDDDSPACHGEVIAEHADRLARGENDAE